MTRIKFIFIISTLILSAIMFGQDSKVHLGVELGPSFRALLNVESELNSIGYSAGLFLQYDLSNRFAIKAIPSFERKGNVTSFIVTSNMGQVLETHNLFVDFDYLVLPVLLNFYLDKKNHFFVNVGPYLGYLLQSKVSVKEFIENINDIPSLTMEEDIDYGISAGIGGNITLTEKYNLAIAIRRNEGLQDFRLNNYFETRNRTFNLLFTFVYKLS